MGWNTQQLLPQGAQRFPVPRQAQKVIVIFAALVLFLFIYSPGYSPQQSHLPSGASAEFPRKIWQLWKVNAYSISESEKKRTRSWAELNPTFRYEMLSDTNEEGYVQNTYGVNGLNRPDIVQWYLSVKDRIVRADVLRYLIMYAEGGVYADFDVEDLQPVHKWIPDHYDQKDVEMVIGIEIDQPDFAQHAILGKKSTTFCQWTFMSKPRHPIMLRLVENIMIWLARVAEERGSTISDVKLDFTDIISGTGPSAFRSVVMDYMAQQLGHEVSWSTFHNTLESKLVAGILVLPVEAFAAGQGHSDSGNHETRRAFIRHHYHASKWPETHPMFAHPMYGMVEHCNWRKDCVQKWDDDVEAWKKLPETEQQVALEAKKAEEDEKKKEDEIKEEKRLKEEKKKQKQEERERRMDECREWFPEYMPAASTTTNMAAMPTEE